jgi:hypothetical protein
LAVMDKILASMKSSGVEERLSYNKHHIALARQEITFVGFIPEKRSGFAILSSS